MFQNNLLFLHRPRHRIVAAISLALLVIGSIVAVDFLLNDDPAVKIATDVPATNPLFIPALLEPNLEDGIARYQLDLKPAFHDYYQAKLTPTIAYNQASILGPTLHLHRGDRAVINVTNHLDEDTTTHWHGADLPAEADGGAHSLIRPNETWTAEFDVIQEAATLWYHPHVKDRTAEQVYRGAAGLMLVDDDNPAASQLPSTYGIDDIPIILQDKDFTKDGELDFTLTNYGKGYYYSRLTVNGTIDPYIEVPAGLVRLRLLNGSQARLYNLSVDSGKTIAIASEGGYLNHPIEMEQITLVPGDRAEIIVDLSNGDRLNLLDASFGRVLELRADESLAAISNPIPSTLNHIERINPDEVNRSREFIFDKVGRGWGINGRQMQMNRIDDTIKFGDTERWTLQSVTGWHVFHVHQTQFQVVERNGKPPEPYEQGWEDTIFFKDRDTVTILARFNTYTNPDIPYMLHCHILDHEDTGMMSQFKIVD
ncbi:multicopper oxidase family protein [Roseofilum casamattae]|uniref:Multicopper oxidase domain-containing protein n=1 Tax=Roseofilum casamattae BLCC-M143 TaxID=3022442 RepID=A0ABT7C2T1_9CYAN|nr:multicopper oxidase domain-containing protein [Roseofilum casamattae]MDJ1185775.1 multicopper oxidase domain-containing protein [Roseofilum casamattae BLCC-M143]